MSQISLQTCAICAMSLYVRDTHQRFVESPFSFTISMAPNIPLSLYLIDAHGLSSHTYKYKLYLLPNTLSSFLFFTLYSMLILLAQ